MIDIGFVRVRDLLTPDEILVEADSIYLRVGKVRNVDRVIIDDISVPYTISLGMVKVLTDDVKTSMERIEVVLSDFTGAGKAKAEFILTSENVLISGRQALLQEIVRLLFARPRSNTFRPQEGGGALQSIASVFPDERLTKVRAVTAIRVVEDQIRRQQVLMRGLSAEERLISITVTNVTVGEDNASIEAIVTTQKGRSLIGLRV